MGKWLPTRRRVNFCVSVLQRVSDIKYDSQNDHGLLCNCSLKLLRDSLDVYFVIHPIFIHPILVVFSSPSLSAPLLHLTSKCVIIAPPPNLSRQTGMRSYFNGGGGESSTPPASAHSAYGNMGGMGRRSTAGSSSASLLPTATPRSSASLPRSPDNPGGGGTNGSMMHGSNQEVYVNIYQNTNHPSLFVSCFYICSRLISY